MTTSQPFPASVLVDAGAWLALSDRNDDNCEPARIIQQAVAQHRPRLFVTNFLIDETYTVIRSRLNRRLAVRFLEDIYASNINRIRVTSHDEALAEEILRRYADKRFSYTDATSLVVMERLRIESAFTFDKNFTEYGRVHVLKGVGNCE